MSGATDSGMIKTMGVVMAALVLFAIICAVAARMLSGPGSDPNDPMLRSALMDRLKPVGSIRTSADDLPAASQSAVTAAADAPKTAQKLVDGACAACHIAGIAEAPKLDDEAAWAARREAGLDALVASVINGKGSMPARGGSAYTDEEIRRAVQHIALFEVDEATDSTQSAAEEDAAQNDQSTTNDSTSAESSSDASSAEAAPSADDGEAKAQVESNDSTESVASQADGTQVATASALTVGSVPEGLTDNIKAQVDGVCAGCHIAGVAEAPKIGDREAWQLRADKGLEALTNSVINGLNVMPPRGGSTLTDEEMPVAIQYLMSK